MNRSKLYRDVVRPTDLNRRSGEILERAARYPVLIARGDDPLLLARHEWVSQLVGSEERAELLSDLVAYLTKRLSGDRSDLGGPLEWLGAFSDAEVSEFVAELRGAVRDVQADTAPPELVDAIVHEWHESAIRPKEYLTALKRTAAIRAR